MKIFNFCKGCWAINKKIQKKTKHHWPDCAIVAGLTQNSTECGCWISEKDEIFNAHKWCEGCCQQYPYCTGKINGVDNEIDDYGDENHCLEWNDDIDDIPGHRG